MERDVRLRPRTKSISYAEPSLRNTVNSGHQSSKGTKRSRKVHAKMAVPLPALVLDLPTEILEIVFQFALRPLNACSYYEDLHTILSVCRRWKSITLASPRFWFLVSGFGHSPSMATILSRSKARPLVIQPHYYVGSPEKDRALFGQIDRWKSATINLSSSDAVDGEGVLVQLWTQPSSSVEDVALIGLPLNPKFRVARTNLFGGRAPRLRSLRLVSCWVDVASPVFQQLHLLEFTDVFLQGVSLFTFLRFLDRLKSLKSLKLDSCKFDNRALRQEARPIPGDVTLPQLKAFDLSGVRPMETVLLLATPSLPRCLEMRVGHHAETEENQEDAPLSVMTLSLIPILKRIASSADHIMVTLDYEEDETALRVLGTSNDQRTLDLRIQNVEPVEALAQLITGWGLYEIKASITIVLIFPDGEPQKLINFAVDLQLLPSITKLVLFQCNITPVLFAFSILSDPQIVNEQYAWVCPNLEHLIILDCADYPGEKAVSMLEHRYGEQYETPTAYVVGSPPPQRPKRLKEIVLQGAEYDPTCLDLLVKAVAPDGCIIVKGYGALSLSDLKIPNLEDESDEESRSVSEGYSTGGEELA